MSRRPPAALVLFSGGKDSAAAAAHYLRRGWRVHLLTFDNGAESRLESAAASARHLIRHNPGRCTWRLASSRRLFHALAIRPLERDVARFGNLVCCGCKLAMLAEAIRFARRRGITVIADGFERGQRYYPEQTRDYMDAADALAREFGIRYEHPVYHLGAAAIRRLARAAGSPARPKQAACLFGFHRVRDRDIAAYTATKLPAVRRHIRAQRRPRA